MKNNEQEVNVIRNHPIFIFKSMLKNIKDLIFIFIFSFVSGLRKTDFLSNSIGVFVAILFFVSIFILINFFRWKKNIFYTKNNLLVVESGLITKSKYEIPFSKVYTVDINQSAVDQFLDICTIKIDTGVVTSEEAEFKFNVKKDVAQNLKREILAKIKDENENLGEEIIETKDLKQQTINKKSIKEEDYKESEFIKSRKITFKEIVTYAVTKNKVGWFFGIAIALNRTLDDISKWIGINLVGKLENKIDISSIQNQKLHYIIIIVIAFILTTYIAVVILNIVVEMIRLYDFTVDVYSDKVSINYGLFNKKQYSFKINKINGIKYKQNSLQQMFKIGELELMAIGYGDEKKEKAVLFPVISESEKIKDLLSDLDVKVKCESVPEISKINYKIKNIIYSLILLVPIDMMYFFIWKNDSNLIINRGIVIINIIILIVYLLSGTLEYKNTSFGFNDEIIKITTGGLKKTTVTLKEENIQSVQKTQNYWLRKKNLAKINIDLYANEIGDSLKIKYADAKVYDKLKNEIKY